MNRRQGHLALYFGPMTSGKTTTLLGKLTTLADTGLSAMYINHSSHNKELRSSNSDCIVSTHHSGYGKYSSKILGVTTDLLRSLDVSSVDVIGVDEGQFFPDLYDTVRDWINDRSKIVMVAGLDGDFEMKPFGQILSLIPIADDVKKFKARCQRCIDTMSQSNIIGDILYVHAPFTARLSGGKEQTVIGGKAQYMAMCRFHHQQHTQRYMMSRSQDDVKTESFLSKSKELTRSTEILVPEQDIILDEHTCLDKNKIIDPVRDVDDLLINGNMDRIIHPVKNTDNNIDELVIDGSKFEQAKKIPEGRRALLRSSGSIPKTN